MYTNLQEMVSKIALKEWSLDGYQAFLTAELYKSGEPTEWKIQVN